jgi:hypothetical protein
MSHPDPMAPRPGASCRLSVLTRAPASAALTRTWWRRACRIAGSAGRRRLKVLSPAGLMMEVREQV